MKRCLRPLLAFSLPLLVAGYSPLSLLAANVAEVRAVDSLRAFLVLSVGAVVLTLAVWAIYRDLGKASLLVSLGLVIVLSYGHLYNEVRTTAFMGVVLGRHRYLLPLSGAILAGAAIWMWRRPAIHLRTVGGFALVALGLTVWNLIPLARFYLVRPDTTALAGPRATVLPAVPSEAAGSLPDIYYIILDGHGRSDSLQDIFGYDSRGFLKQLDDLGFYVAEGSQSNYAQTSLSLASSLNMTYLTDLANALGPNSGDHRPAEEMVNRNLVFELAETLGYSTVAFESAAPFITFEAADEFLAPDFSQSRQEAALLRGLSLNPFEGILLETTAGRIFFDLYLREQNRVRPIISDFLYQKHRERILFQLLTLPSLASREGPQLVVAHVMSPHPPFVFGTHGEQVANPRAFSLQDVGCCSAEEYIERYRDQVGYIDQLVVQAVKGILANSSMTPIIVIQGDHGPGATLDWRNPSLRGRQERMAILNAYLVPDRCREHLYPDISPVNTFRLIFGYCLGVDANLVSDETFFSTYWRPYDFAAVEDRLPN